MALFIDGVLTMSESEFALKARAVKVDALVAQIVGEAEDGDRSDPLWPWEIGERDAGWWAERAARAGVRVPSGISRDRVVIELCKRVNAERNGATEPCPDCQGSLTVNVRGGGNGELDRERNGERRLYLGALDPAALGVDPELTLIMSKASADKARQIGVLLILGAEDFDPTGLEIVRNPAAPEAPASTESQALGGIGPDAGAPAGAGESDIELARRRFG